MEKETSSPVTLLIDGVQHDVFCDFDKLNAHVQKFLSSTKHDDIIYVGSCLRRDMRKFKEYPLYYFAFGVGATYRLVLSKFPFGILWKNLSNKCRKCFIEYSGLSMSTDDEIENTLYTYLGLDVWFSMLSDALLELGGEQEFINKHFDLISKITKSLCDSPKYQEFVDLDVKPLESTRKFSTVNVYGPTNNGKCFMSVDLKNANFQVIRNAGLTNKKSWSDFLNQFTTIPYFHHLKFLRLKALSSHQLFPKKQQILWHNTIIQIYDALIKDQIVPYQSLAALNSDEIIFEGSDFKKSFIQGYLIGKFSNIETSVETFQIKRVNDNYLYFVKINLETKKHTFKCCNYLELPKAISLFKI